LHNESVVNLVLPSEVADSGLQSCIGDQIRWFHGFSCQWIRSILVNPAQDCVPVKAVSCSITERMAHNIERNGADEVVGDFKSRRQIRVHGGRRSLKSFDETKAIEDDFMLSCVFPKFLSSQPNPKSDVTQAVSAYPLLLLTHQMPASHHSLKVSLGIMLVDFSRRHISPYSVAQKSFWCSCEIRNCKNFRIH